MDGVGFYYSVLLLIAANVYDVCCVCDETNAIEFPYINETLYDRTYASITEENKRPLGFLKGTIPYNDPTRPNPCIKISGVNGRRIEIMAETDPIARLCVTDQNAANQLCEQHKIYECRQAMADTVYFEYFCDAACSEDDVTFWYRFVISPPGMNDPEMWCFERNTAEYPDSLAPIVPGLTPPPKQPPPSNRATSIELQLPTYIILISACLLLIAQRN